MNLYFKKIPFKNRPCKHCGKVLPASKYNETKSIFALDGRLDICKECLNKLVYQEEGLWDLVDEVCQWANVPFIPEKFTQLYDYNPEQAMGLYLDMFSEAEYDRVVWKDYHEKWKKIIEEGNEKNLHPDFNTKEIEDLKKKWGAYYSAEALYQLEDLYKGIETSYGFSDVIAEDNAKKMAKISYEIDRAIANGDTIDKLITAYNKLQTSAGFTSDNARDANSFESISEIVMYYEKIGWLHKFHNDEDRDIVDTTIKNIQAYNARLWANESTIVDQVEERLTQKRNINNLENRLESEDEQNTKFLTPDENYCSFDEEEDEEFDLGI